MVGSPEGVRSPRVVRFGVFEVDLRAGELRKRGVRLRLQQQPFTVLRLLLERPGDVVLRDELRERLWPGDTFVDFDHGLNKAVNKLRETLGDSAESPRFIETLAKRGYRFIAPVEVVDEGRPHDAGAALTPPGAPAPAAPIHEAVAADAPLRAAGRRRGWIHGAALVVMAAAVGLGYLLATRERPATSAARLMLAVLPFADLEGDEERAYFTDGMTEEMILQLSRLNPDRLGVIARTSSMHYKNSAKRADEIARELGVGYLLEGSVRRSGTRVRIAARLIDASNQTPLWSEIYERDQSDILDIQSDVSRRIAEALTLELLARGGDGGAAASRVESAVYDAYLKGRYHWNRRTPVDLERAVALLEDAYARDPSYVPAATALADALNVLPWYGLRPPREAYPRSKDVARRALAVDETSAAAHTALAYAHHYFDWNWSEAEREYARAIALNPNYAQAHQWLGAHYAELGRTGEALAAMRRAEQLDPRSLIVQAAIGWIHYLGRRHDLAIAQLERTLAIEPDFVPARLWLAQALEAARRPEDAIAHTTRVRELAGAAPTGLGELARSYAAAGRIAEARAALAELLQSARTRYVEGDLVARVYVALGEHDAALDWLDRARDERAVKMVLIGVDPQFDALRAHPRFVRLVSNLALPAAPVR